MTPELRIVGPPNERQIAATLELISRAREYLIEARTLPDIRRVIEAATVAADAAQRAAKVFEAQDAAVEVARAARTAANDAAAVRIEAQARAGELLQQMAQQGRRAVGRTGKVSRPSTLSDLHISRNESALWQQVAAVPAEVRAAYFDQTSTNQGEVTTAGLLQHARGTEVRVPDRSRAASRASIDHAAVAAEARKRMRAAYRSAIALSGVRPEALVGALDSVERRRLLQALGQLPTWMDDLRRELAVYRIVEEE